MLFNRTTTNDAIRTMMTTKTTTMEGGRIVPSSPEPVVRKPTRKAVRFSPTSTTSSLRSSSSSSLPPLLPCDDDDDSSHSSSNSSLEAPTPVTKTVRFNCAMVKKTISWKEMTPEELATTWYTAEEQTEIRTQCRDLARTYTHQHGDEDDDNEDDALLCYRGLESYLPHTAQRKRMHRCEATILVLEEQDYQDFQYQDYPHSAQVQNQIATAIAEAYQTYSIECQFQAELRALQDHNDVLKIVQQDAREEEAAAAAAAAAAHHEQHNSDEEYDDNFFVIASSSSALSQSMASPAMFSSQSSSYNTRKQVTVVPVHKKQAHPVSSIHSLPQSISPSNITPAAA